MIDTTKIVKKLKTLPTVSAIFGTDIYAGSKFVMKPGKFLIVSRMQGDIYMGKSEVGPTDNRYQLQFIIVGLMDDSEKVVEGYLQTIIDAIGVSCGTIEDWEGLRTRSVELAMVSPIVYNQERPTLTADFTFII